MLRKLTRSVLTKAEYYQNDILATRSKTFHRIELPLPSIKHEPGAKQVKKVSLVSIPIIEFEEKTNPYQEARDEFSPDTIFVQEKPMDYISSHRKINLKIIRNTLDSYTAAQNIEPDYPKPTFPEEVYLNAVQLKLLKQLPQGALVPDDSKMSPDKILKDIVSDLQNYVFSTFSEYPYITDVIMQSVIEAETTVLGDMPEQLLRMQVANTLSLQDLHDIKERCFKEVMQSYKDDPNHLVYSREVVYRHFSDIFSYPRDYYMTSLLKEACKDTDGVLAFIGAPHIFPVQKLWQTKTSFRKACEIPARLASDTVETLIEKHALMDALLETQVWNEYYTLNPFPYLGQLDEIKENLPFFKAYFLKMSIKFKEEAADKVPMPEELSNKFDEYSRLNLEGEQQENALNISEFIDKNIKRY